MIKYQINLFFREEKRIDFGSDAKIKIVPVGFEPTRHKQTILSRPP